MDSSILSRLQFPMLLLGLLGLILLSACNVTSVPAEANDLQAPEAVVVINEPAELAHLSAANESDAYETVMEVLTHPRCSNCHPVDHVPRQTDAQIEHLFNVTRGEADHGGPVQTCETCHHEENNSYSRVPGAPHWGLAPHSMGWLGLSHDEIARNLIDPTKNGGRDFDALLHHMREDALVLWGWDPGEGRTPIPVPHDEFVEALEIWLDAGAPIPAE